MGMPLSVSPMEAKHYARQKRDKAEWDFGFLLFRRQGNVAAHKKALADAAASAKLIWVRTSAKCD
jgi:hypothetical protein